MNTMVYGFSSVAYVALEEKSGPVSSLYRMTPQAKMSERGEYLARKRHEMEALRENHPPVP